METKSKAKELDTEVIRVGLSYSDNAWYADIVSDEDPDEDEDGPEEWGYILEITLPKAIQNKVIKVEIK